LKIIRPGDVPPTVNPAIPATSDGRRVHRRVLSPMTGGPKSIDIGYNSFKASPGGHNPYAYTKDEFCYTVSGEMHNTSSGVQAISQPGMFMWRPAGTATHIASIKSDTVTICAFGPARVDNFSHALPSVGEWDGNEATRRAPRRRHYSEVEPVTLGAGPRDSRVIHRPIWSLVRDGSKFMEVSHTMVTGEVTWHQVTDERDVVWFLEKGEILLSCGGQKSALHANEFLYRAPGDVVDTMTAAPGSVVIAWSAPPIP
jgi:mannose-6-phosphate isomerase-like protein (cupin superfamily)/uncharacterized cupin superfamily protein